MTIKGPSGRYLGHRSVKIFKEPLVGGVKRKRNRDAEREQHEMELFSLKTMRAQLDGERHQNEFLMRLILGEESDDDKR